MTVVATADLTYVEVTHVQTGTRVFAAFHEDLPIGVLTVDEPNNLVELVYVQDFARRSGVATALLAFAREKTGLTLDKDFGERSLLGSKWARSVGLTCVRYRRYSQREANAAGSKLMLALWGWRP